MPDCYYTCNLLPLGLITRAGLRPRWLGNHLRDPGSAARRDSVSVHPMTCPYVTKLVAAAEELFGRPGVDGDCLVVPGGCDAARRMGDLLAAQYPDRVFMLHMPRASGEQVAARLASDLKRLDDWLQFRGADGTGSSRVHDQAPDEAETPSLAYATPPQPGGVFVVSGPLSNDSLLDLVGRLGTHISGLESCTSPDRWQLLASMRLLEASNGGAGTLDYVALASLILETGMCPRRSAVDRRAYLEHRLEESRPGSIIYARQSFCDPGAYDALLVAELARERALPYLEIEVDFPFDANGPLRVRVEAFLEAQLLDDDLLDSEDLFEEV